MWFLACAVLNSNCKYGNSSSIVTAIFSAINIEYTDAPAHNAIKNPYFEWGSGKGKIGWIP